ncbi:hypothetical protein EW146_g6792 [Bondarzewia mesenterica]|uniref:RRM domain-containing protein n=1 Tax=Bondarzewia mesenterica TaxID=1095465 RepID=A0A4S4LMI9_9AGAM|nr:hypothetical protein EW146_g6792 [Bondarzewia mesenterica]
MFAYRSLVPVLQHISLLETLQGESAGLAYYPSTDANNVAVLPHLSRFSIVAETQCHFVYLLGNCRIPPTACLSVAISNASTMHNSTSPRVQMLPFVEHVDLRIIRSRKNQWPTAEYKQEVILFLHFNHGWSQYNKDDDNRMLKLDDVYHTLERMPLIDMPNLHTLKAARDAASGALQALLSQAAKSLCLGRVITDSGSSRPTSVPVSPPTPPPTIHAPTSDEIDAVIQMATSSRPSPDGRPIPLKDTRTQLFIGNSPPHFKRFLCAHATLFERAQQSSHPGVLVDVLARGLSALPISLAEFPGSWPDTLHPLVPSMRADFEIVGDLPKLTWNRLLLLLPYRVRWQDLKDLFRKAGTVLRADVSLGPDNRSRGFGTVLLATAEDAGRAVDMFNGYSWQTRSASTSGYHTPATASFRAVPFGPPPVLLPQPNPGQGMTVMSPGPVFGVPGLAGLMGGIEEHEYGAIYGHERPGTAGAVSRNLFIGNWQDLKDLFRQAGTILRADVALGQDGRSRGFGTVVFATDMDAERAVKMFNGYEYNGRSLKVHFDKYSPSTQPTAPSTAPVSPIPPFARSVVSPTFASTLGAQSHQQQLQPSQMHTPLAMPQAYVYGLGPASRPTSPFGDMFHQQQQQQQAQRRHVGPQQEGLGIMNLNGSGPAAKKMRSFGSTELGVFATETTGASRVACSVPAHTRHDCEATDSAEAAPRTVTARSADAQIARTHALAPPVSPPSRAPRSHSSPAAAARHCISSATLALTFSLLTTVLPWSRHAGSVAPPHVAYAPLAPAHRDAQATPIATAPSVNALSDANAHTDADFVPTHAAFSPGIAMSPGAFWGRPGGAGNPFINAAVGAPVRGQDVVADEERRERRAEEDVGYFPPVREESYFSYVPASGSRLANEILRNGVEATASEASGSGTGSSSVGTGSARERDGVSGVVEQMGALQVDGGDDDVFWSGRPMHNQSGSGQRTQSALGRAPSLPGQMHRTGSDPVQHQRGESGEQRGKEAEERPTTGSGTGPATGDWGERRASFAEVVDGGRRATAAATGLLGSRS